MGFETEVGGLMNMAPDGLPGTLGQPQPYRAKCGEIDEVSREIRLALSRFRADCRRGRFRDDLYETIARTLGRLPLSPAAAAAADVHLKNSERYMRSREIGAADYELRLLLRLFETQEVRCQR